MLRVCSQKQIHTSHTSTLGKNQTRNEGETMSYKSFVSAQTQRNPYLRNLRNFLQDSTINEHACHIACLAFSSTCGPPSRRSLNVDGLASLLLNKAHGRDHLCGRLLIVEDLSGDVETLGSQLNIDPFFFASHIDTSEVDIATTRPSMAILPSTRRSQNFLNLHYHRAIEFEDLKSTNLLLRDMNVSRPVKILPQLKGITIGLARHCCSILKTEGRDGLWLGTRDLIDDREILTGKSNSTRTNSC